MLNNEKLVLLQSKLSQMNTIFVELKKHYQDYVGSEEITQTLLIERREGINFGTEKLLELEEIIGHLGYSITKELQKFNTPFHAMNKNNFTSQIECDKADDLWNLLEPLTLYVDFKEFEDVWKIYMKDGYGPYEYEDIYIEVCHSGLRRASYVLGALKITDEALRRFDVTAYLSFSDCSIDVECFEKELNGAEYDPNIHLALLRRTLSLHFFHAACEYFGRLHGYHN